MYIRKWEVGYQVERIITCIPIMDTVSDTLFQRIMDTVSDTLFQCIMDTVSNKPLNPSWIRFVINSATRACRFEDSWRKEEGSTRVGGRICSSSDDEEEETMNLWSFKDYSKQIDE